MSIFLSVNTTFALFFFSSRRRHTRFDCDWSSDVCSSDLVTRALVVEWHAASEADPRIVELRTALAHHGLAQSRPLRPLRRSTTAGSLAVNGLELFTRKRSEERRVGKECRSRGSRND